MRVGEERSIGQSRLVLSDSARYEQHRTAIVMRTQNGYHCTITMRNLIEHISGSNLSSNMKSLHTAVNARNVCRAMKWRLYTPGQTVLKWPEMTAVHQGRPWKQSVRDCVFYGDQMSTVETCLCVWLSRKAVPLIHLPVLVH